MATEENLDLDVPAAELRADAGDVAMSIEVLATSLEQALPGIATVERHRVGGFRSKRREVRRIAVALGEELFELNRANGALECSRHKVVRGITIAREQLPLAGWIAALVHGVTQRAEIGERDRAALEGLLR
jgi:hypothetical protein